MQHGVHNSGGSNWHKTTGPHYAEARAFVLAVSAEKEVEA
jgi:hypothetical protein